MPTTLAVTIFLLRAFVFFNHRSNIGRLLSGTENKFGGKRKRRWHRKHRNYYRVLTEEEEVFEIYFDRGSKDELWILCAKLE